jgi:DNA-binding GntR family transcriptional regulator
MAAAHAIPLLERFMRRPNRCIRTAATREIREARMHGIHSDQEIMQPKIETRAQPSKPPKAGQRRSADAKSGDPLYLQIARVLKKEIVDGVYPVGSQLPTEDDLCERFSVSRYTVREALRRLRDDHLVSSRPRAGTIVIPRRSSNSYAHDVMSINDLVSWAAGKRFVIESIEMVPIDEKLAFRTGLASGEKWLAVRGFGHTDDTESPYCWAEYYIHRDYAAVGRLLPRHTGPIFPLLEDLFGLSVVEVHQEIGATLIPPALVSGLKAAAGTAALEVRRWYKTSDGQLAQLTISTHPASRYKHSMTMRRVRD